MQDEGRKRVIKRKTERESETGRDKERKREQGKKENERGRVKWEKSNKI